MARYAAYAFGVPIPINQPGVGGNAFAHGPASTPTARSRTGGITSCTITRSWGGGSRKPSKRGARSPSASTPGSRGFRNVYDKLEIEFKDDAEAEKILELARYANVHTQKPLTAYELKFIAAHPEIARRIMTVTP